MAEVLDTENDQFLKLLTEAMRSGPGSPEWHEAVQKLRAGAGGGGNADEYRLILQAREDLESGKGYRAVRAGPGFTKKVMEGVGREEVGKGPAISSAGVITLLSAVAILAVIGAVAYILSRGGQEGKGAVDELAGVVFVNTAASATFENSIPAEWERIGALPLEAKNGLRAGGVASTGPATAPATVKAAVTGGGATRASKKARVPVGDGRFTGGGLVWGTAISPGETFAVEVEMRVQRASEDLVAQVFATDEKEFGGEPATSPHELVWLVRGGQQQVALPDGRVGAAGERIKLPATVTVRVLVNRDVSVVESSAGDGGSKRLWAGENQLGADSPRYVGVRFLRRAGSERQDAVVIQSVQVKTSKQ